MTVEQKTRLTDAEKRCLKAFSSARRRIRNFPELKDVAVEMGTTKQHVSALLQQLTAKGRVVKEGRYRGYRTVRNAR